MVGVVRGGFEEKKKKSDKSRQRPSFCTRVTYSREKERGPLIRYIFLPYVSILVPPATCPSMSLSSDISINLSRFDLANVPPVQAEFNKWLDAALQSNPKWYQIGAPAYRKMRSEGKARAPSLPRSIRSIKHRARMLGVPLFSVSLVLIFPPFAGIIYQRRRPGPREKLHHSVA